MNFKSISLLLCIIFLSEFSIAQVGINDDDTNPDASSMLDIKSTTAGILIPRMTTAQQDAISNPAVGLLIFNTDTESFWFKNTNAWIELKSGNIREIVDEDNDTKINLEEHATNDKINFELNGVEYMSLDSGRVSIQNTGGSIIIGENAGLADDYNNNNNVFIGDQVGMKTTNGGNNIGLGYKVLINNISGENNIALGRYALSNNTIGKNNTAISKYALSDNTTGEGNIAIGEQSLVHNTIGNRNVSFGGYSLWSNTTGEDNIAIGEHSLVYNTIGSRNIAFGRYALWNNTTGNISIAIGRSALYKNEIGRNNIAIGEAALYNNVSGEKNVALGTRAGYQNTGSGSVFIGPRVGYYETDSCRLYIHNSDTIAPLIYGEFDNDLLRINGTLNINNAFSFPVADGTNEQTLITDGNGTLSWMTLAHNNNQTLTLSNNSLSLTNGSIVDLSGYLDNTDAQNLSLSDNILSISNGGSINLEQYANSIVDADNDTKIILEEHATNDKINFELNGIEYMNLDFGRISIQNTGGSVFIGKEAGINDDLTNNYNAFIGYRSGKANTSGSYNASFGAYSGQNITTGQSNTSIGSSAGGALTTGGSNVAIGRLALYDVETGSDNVAIGMSTLEYGSSGNSENTAIGSTAGWQMTGNGNVFLGYKAGFQKSGNNRLFIANSGTGNPLIYGEFDNKILKINGATILNQQGSDLDFQVKGDNKDNLIFADASTDKVGIGTNVPSEALEIVGHTKISNNEPKLVFHDNSDLRTSYIKNVLPTYNLIDGDAQFANHKMEFYVSGSFNGSKKVITLKGDQTTEFHGNVGIGTSSPTYKLQVGNNGDGTTARANAWNTFSDRRLKRNFQKIEHPIEKLNALNGYYYHWTADKKDQSRQLGVIAQEVETVLPEIVKTDDEGIKSVDYSKLTAYLIEVNKAQQTEIDQLKADRENLKIQVTKINEIEAKLNALLESNHSDMNKTAQK